MHPSRSPQDIAVFRPQKQGIRKILGDLEADVMEAIWAAGDGARVTVREIHAQLLTERDLAYTTIMTVMGHLAKKGLLRVEKDSFAHGYRATQSREVFTRQVVGNILDELLADFAEPALAHFAERLPGEDPAKLAMLEALVHQRREQER